MSINTARVVGGGLVAGVVMNVIDATVNGAMLSARWTSESAALNARINAAGTQSMIGWILVDFIAGVFIVWLYAAMRPRYGAGPGTALKAGFATWFITHVFMAAFVFMDLYTPNLMLMVSLGGLVAALAGAYTGGMIYKEEGEVAARAATA